MRRICHMTSVHNSYDTRIFYKECVSLANAGYEVYLVASGDSRQEMGVNVVGIGKTPSSRIKRMTYTASAVYKKALELDCEIYHIHDPELLPYGIKLKRKGKKVIFDSHEDIMSYVADKPWIPYLLRIPIDVLFRKYCNYVIPKFNAIISVTPHIQIKLEALNTSTSMITNYPIINYGDTKLATNCSNQTLKLVFAGGVTEQWSHEDIIKAIQEVENAHYDVYGKVSSTYLQHLNNLDDKGKFNYKGIIPHSKVSKVLSSGSVGMALCKYSKNSDGKNGTLGNTKLFEYFNVGLPVICTDFELWKDIVSRYNCGICVQPDNTEQIAQAIETLRDNPSLTAQMGCNGRKAVEEEFNWASQEKKLAELYFKL